MVRRSLLAGGLLPFLGRRAFAADDGFVGRWTGALDAGGQRLRLRFEVGADGSVKVHSLDQGGVIIPAKRVAGEPGELKVDVPAVKGGFTGRLTAPDRIEGVWRQGGELPLVLLRGDAVEAPAPAEPLTAERLAALRRRAGSPALAAAAAGAGTAPRFWVDGERSIGSGVAATVDDLWHLGSITKSITATLVARMVEAGRVGWDDTVGGRLGPVIPKMRPAYRSVTFRHLFSHRAGLPANLPMPDLLRYPRENVDSRADRVAYARQALSMAPVGPAGATFIYANNGYVVAAAMLEAAAGEPWETLVRQHVTEPLGLASAGFGAPGRAGALDQPVGHADAPSGRRPYPPGGGLTDNPAVLGPAGRVHMSLDDLLTYLGAHRDRTAFLRPESWRVLHTPPFGGDYALGWIVRPDGALWHNGSNTLWYAEALVSPGGGVVAAACSNDGHLPASSPAVAAALTGAAAAV